MQSPLPSPSSVSSKPRSFQRSNPSSSCPSPFFGLQGSSSSRGLAFGGIPDCEYFPRTPPPPPPPSRQDSPTSSWWSLRCFSSDYYSNYSSSSTMIPKKEHWNTFHKRFQSTPPDKLERIYRPGWSNTSDPIIFDRQAHEQQRQESASAASPNLVVRLVHCMFLDCTTARRRTTTTSNSSSSSSLEDDTVDDAPWQRTTAMQRHRAIRSSRRRFLNRRNRREHDHFLTE
jgi:hypothetical protein